MNATLELESVVMRQTASMELALTYVVVKKSMKIILLQNLAHCVSVFHDQVQNKELHAYFFKRTAIPPFEVELIDMGVFELHN